MSATLFRKTPLGHSEIAQRSQGLPALARRLLILVDGAKTLAQLSALSGAGAQTDSLLQALHADGFIEAMQPGGAASAAVQPGPVTATIPAPAPAAPAPAQPAISNAQLQLVKRLMLDSSRDYLGLMGVEIQARIEQAQDALALRNCLARWSLALRESRQGSQLAAPYLAQVKALLEA
ncbi:hypothetical protein [Chitinimonas taiwanensis]|jgi:hypothetical protein|uniref:Uncharacterized protein n=1 Tax=Chitinimonas taiwanensis DSM 18899 TaxID=1121279 RepID=A0A1K2HJ69_9NEIS|nr:hypothetical protein [Chitinimonas taiwanensis]SFZ76888.1 hypothetical protein SAMN02745887_02136 [Chitinimonas taiwanensis DSM 18899]